MPKNLEKLRKLAEEGKLTYQLPFRLPAGQMGIGGKLTQDVVVNDKLTLPKGTYIDAQTHRHSGTSETLYNAWGLKPIKGAPGFFEEIERPTHAKIGSGVALVLHEIVDFPLSFLRLGTQPGMTAEAADRGMRPEEAKSISDEVATALREQAGWKLWVGTGANAPKTSSEDPRGFFQTIIDTIRSLIQSLFSDSNKTSNTSENIAKVSSSIQMQPLPPQYRPPPTALPAQPAPPSKVSEQNVETSPSSSPSSP